MEEHTQIAYISQTLFLNDWVHSWIIMLSDVLENGNVKPVGTICNVTDDKPSKMLEYRVVQCSC